MQAMIKVIFVSLVVSLVACNNDSNTRPTPPPPPATPAPQDGSGDDSSGAGSIDKTLPIENLAEEANGITQLAAEGKAVGNLDVILSSRLQRTGTSQQTLKTSENANAQVYTCHLRKQNNQYEAIVSYKGLIKNKYEQTLVIIAPITLKAGEGMHGLSNPVLNYTLMDTEGFDTLVTNLTENKIENQARVTAYKIGDSKLVIAMNISASVSNADEEVILSGYIRCSAPLSTEVKKDFEQNAELKATDLIDEINALRKSNQEVKTANKESEPGFFSGAWTSIVDTIGPFLYDNPNVDGYYQKILDEQDEEELLVNKSLIDFQEPAKNFIVPLEVEELVGVNKNLFCRIYDENGQTRLEINMIEDQWVKADITLKMSFAIDKNLRPTPNSPIMVDYMTMSTLNSSELQEMYNPTSTQPEKQVAHLKAFRDLPGSGVHTRAVIYAIYAAFNDLRGKPVILTGSVQCTL
jgi:hypothetical protein